MMCKRINFKIKNLNAPKSVGNCVKRVKKNSLEPSDKDNNFESEILHGVKANKHET